MFQQFNLSDLSSLASTQLIQQKQQQHYQQLFSNNSQTQFPQCPSLNINGTNSIINNTTNITPFQSIHQMQSQQLASLQQLSMQIDLCKQSLESHILAQNNTLILSSLLQQNQPISLMNENNSLNINMNYSSQLFPQMPIFHCDTNIPTSIQTNPQSPVKLQQFQQKTEESSTSSAQILSKQEEDPSSQSGCTLQFSSSSSFQTSSSIKIRIPASGNLNSNSINELKQNSKSTLSSDEKIFGKNKKQAKKQTLSKEQLESTIDNTDRDAKFDEIKTEEQQSSHCQDEEDTCSLEQDILSQEKSKKPKRIETAIDNKSRNFSKNLLKSFFKYAQQQNQGDKRFLFNFKRYTTCNKAGNQFIIKLLKDSPYSDIFNEFLGKPADDWISESKVHNRVEQIKFLEMCRDGTVTMLQKREFPKKKSLFSLKRR